MQLPATIQLGPSPALAGLLACAHGGAFATLLALGLPAAIMITAGTCIAISAAWQVRRALRPPIASIAVDAAGHAEIAGHDGRRVPVAIHGQTTVSPACIVLLLRHPDGILVLALLPDAVGSEAHRRLRLWLRWRAANG